MTGGISLKGAPVGRWALEHDGRLLEAETRRDGRRRTVRLYVDGVPAGEASGFNPVTVPFGDAAVRAVFDAVGLVDGQAARCELVPRGGDREGAEDGDEPAAETARKGVPFTPPEGTRAARREALARAHPVLYASRHVVVAAGKVLFPLLGLGVLVRMLVGLVPWPHVDLPEVSLPDVDPPDLPLPDVPWPDIDLPDVSAPWWVQALLASAKFWGPLLIAVGVAAREVSRRKRRHAEDDARRDGTGTRPPGEGPPDERRTDRSGRGDRGRLGGDRRGNERRPADRESGADRERVGNRAGGG
ncbi:hypothetical protein [Actinomadura sediminis]|uniref:DUF2207 domain-containing protein n=1 Tax=Actinomadura sediminis TaxID=1038904 RepID=A0ABW3F508_9ACTN